MNTTPSQQSPNLEMLRQAVREYQPNPRRVPFNNLNPLHDSIAEMRRKCASYATIAELLQQHGVKTSRARVAEYGRIVLNGGKSRKRRRQANAAPAISTLVAAPIAPVAATPDVTAPTAATTSSLPPPRETSPYASRGPRIANVRLLNPQEAKGFNDSLKAPKP
jgi:hypothetical protein